MDYIAQLCVYLVFGAITGTVIGKMIVHAIQEYLDEDKDSNK